MKNNYSLPWNKIQNNFNKLQLEITEIVNNDVVLNDVKINSTSYNAKVKTKAKAKIKAKTETEAEIETKTDINTNNNENEKVKRRRIKIPKIVTITNVNSNDLVNDVNDDNDDNDDNDVNTDNIDINDDKKVKKELNRKSSLSESFLNKDLITKAFINEDLVNKDLITKTSINENLSMKNFLNDEDVIKTSIKDKYKRKLTSISPLTSNNELYKRYADNTSIIKENTNDKENVSMTQRFQLNLYRPKTLIKEDDYALFYCYKGDEITHIELLLIKKKKSICNLLAKHNISFHTQSGNNSVFISTSNYTDVQRILNLTNKANLRFINSRFHVLTSIYYKVENNAVIISFLPGSKFNQNVEINTNDNYSSTIENEIDANIGTNIDTDANIDIDTSIDIKVDKQIEQVIIYRWNNFDETYDKLQNLLSKFYFNVDVVLNHAIRRHYS